MSPRRRSVVDMGAFNEGDISRTIPDGYHIKFAEGLSSGVVANRSMPGDSLAMDPIVFSARAGPGQARSSAVCSFRASEWLPRSTRLSAKPGRRWAMNELRGLEGATGDQSKGVKLLHNAASASTGKPIGLKYVEESDVSGLPKKRSSADKAFCHGRHDSGAAPG
jgi:hypothetical protein